MMRTLAAIGALALVFLVTGHASAKTEDASVGSYYFEHKGDRKQVVVNEGDQVRFTVNDGIVPPHTVEVDELNIHSGEILYGQSYTTPVLNRPGNFYLHCDPHEDRGHTSRLIVLAKKASSPTAKPKVVAIGSDAPPVAAPASTPTPIPTPAESATPTPEATAVAAGLSTAPPEVLARAVAAGPDPDSLEGLIGRSRSKEHPWTRALLWLLVVSIPIVGAAVFAVWCARQRPAATRLP